MAVCEEFFLLRPDTDLEEVGLEFSGNLVSVGDHGERPGRRDSTQYWRGLEHSDTPDDGIEALSIEAVPETGKLLIGGVEV